MKNENQGSLVSDDDPGAKRNSSKSHSTVFRLTMTVLVLFGLMIFVGHAVESSVFPPLPIGKAVAPSKQGPTPQLHIQQIEVVLDEFSISPSPLRIPAGRPITLVVRNEGRVLHEFMAGREIKNDGFENDLFAGLEIRVSDHTDAGADSRGPDAGGNSEPAVTPLHANGHSSDHDLAEGGHGQHVGDHEHGIMVAPEPGQILYMSFTVPESSRGNWSTGCFLPGHYSAGMHGTLTVE